MGAAFNVDQVADDLLDLTQALVPTQAWAAELGELGEVNHQRV